MQEFTCSPLQERLGNNYWHALEGSQASFQGPNSHPAWGTHSHQKQEVGPSWAPPSKPPQKPRSTGPPRLPCLQVRVCFSPVSFKTHMTPLPKDTRNVLGNCRRAGQEKELAGKALTAQASGVRPGGMGASSNTPSLGNCLSFPHLTIYTWSIFGHFFCNRLVRPPKEACYPKN